jgi:muramoyltetrapeptide carboxypeptidase
MIQHLRFAGVLRQVRGIVLGDMSANVTPEEMPLLEAACLHALQDFDGPIYIGLQCGHVDRNNRSLPLGSWVTMKNGDVSE